MQCTPKKNYFDEIQRPSATLDVLLTITKQTNLSPAIFRSAFIIQLRNLGWQYCWLNCLKLSESFICLWKSINVVECQNESTSLFTVPLYVYYSITVRWLVSPAQIFSQNCLIGKFRKLSKYQPITWRSLSKVLF